jgi:hypothetical protein
MPGFDFMDTNTKICRTLCCFTVLFYPPFLPDPKHNAILAETEIFRTWFSQFPSFGVFSLVQWGLDVQARISLEGVYSNTLLQQVLFAT